MELVLKRASKREVWEKKALAWATLSTGEIYVFPPFAWILFGLSRLEHEVIHVLEDAGNAEMHHPWHHFCVRSPHAIRCRRHGSARTRYLARKLRAQGRIDPSVWSEEKRAER